MRAINPLDRRESLVRVLDRFARKPSSPGQLGFGFGASDAAPTGNPFETTTGSQGRLFGAGGYAETRAKHGRDNCGTGAGGFQPGNTCATGRKKARKEEPEATPPSGQGYRPREAPETFRGVPKSAGHLAFVGDRELFELGKKRDTPQLYSAPIDSPIDPDTGVRREMTREGAVSELERHIKNIATNFAGESMPDGPPSTREELQAYRDALRNVPIQRASDLFALTPNVPSEERIAEQRMLTRQDLREFARGLDEPPPTDPEPGPADDSPRRKAMEAVLARTGGFQPRDLGPEHDPDAVNLPDMPETVEEPEKAADDSLYQTRLNALQPGDREAIPNLVLQARIAGISKERFTEDLLAKEFNPYFVEKVTRDWEARRMDSPAASTPSPMAAPEVKAEPIAPETPSQLVNRLAQEHVSRDREVILDRPPPGGWTEADRVPEQYQSRPEPIEGAEDAWKVPLKEFVGPRPTGDPFSDEHKAWGQRHQAHNKSVIAAVERGETIPKDVAGDYTRTIRNVRKYGQPRPKFYEMDEEDYIQDQHERRISDWKRTLEARQEELARLGPRTGKIKRQEAEYLLRAVQDRLESMAKGPTQSQRESDRDTYIESVKKAISKGEPVPDRVRQSRPEFVKATDARRRYEKGRHTSFANRSAAINEQMREQRGYKVKRQDGKAIEDHHIQEIAQGMDEIETVLGPLKDIMDEADLTIAHTNGKHPFLSDAGGMYHSSDRTISTGIMGLMGPIASLAHELGHFLDFEAGHKEGKRTYQPRKASRGVYSSSLAGAEDHIDLLRDARYSMNKQGRASLLLKSHMNKAQSPQDMAEIQWAKVRLGAYWNRPEEIFARLFEQYIATKLEGKGSRSVEADYSETPAYWTKEKFAELMPQVEKEIHRRLEILRRKKENDTPDRSARRYAIRKVLDRIAVA